MTYVSILRLRKVFEWVRYLFAAIDGHKERERLLALDPYEIMREYVAEEKILYPGWYAYSDADQKKYLDDLQNIADGVEGAIARENAQKAMELIREYTKIGYLSSGDLKLFLGAATRFRKEK
jgi:hypothetical protein